MGTALALQCGGPHSWPGPPHTQALQTPAFPGNYMQRPHPPVTQFFLCVCAYGVREPQSWLPWTLDFQGFGLFSWVSQSGFHSEGHWERVGPRYSGCRDNWGKLRSQTPSETPQSLSLIVERNQYRALLGTQGGGETGSQESAGHTWSVVNATCREQ